MSSHLEEICLCGEMQARGLDLNAYLGVSFSKLNYFSHLTMDRYVRWMGGRFCDLQVIVADQLESHNYEVFKDLDPAEARDRAKRIGTERRDGYLKHSCPEELRRRVTFVLASELLARPGCRRMHALVAENVSGNPRLKRDVRATVSRALLGKLQAAKLIGKRRETALEKLESYLVEEIAIILYLTLGPDKRYDVSIFPYPPPRILVDLYAGAYAGPIAEVTRGLAYRALQVVLKDDGESKLRVGARPTGACVQPLATGA